MSLFLPRIEIALSAIRHNSQILSSLYGKRGISLMGVSKVVLGEPAIANAMIQGGVEFIADSRLENIQRMKNAGVVTRFVLLRTPLSRAEAIVDSVDISLNTELETLKQLSYYARKCNKIHQVMIMVEMGDLREGVLPGDLLEFIAQVILLPHIKIMGIGCNLACFGGIEPDGKNMGALSELVEVVEKKFQLKLEIVSGGNSANYDWYASAQEVGNINSLRLGESILLGREPLNRTVIPGLSTRAFRLVAEVIEAKVKTSLPVGKIGQDAFGHIPKFRDRGMHQRIIIALGRQDSLVSGLQPNDDLEILGASSDHIILDGKKTHLQVGDEVTFGLDYGALLAAMTSPFVQKDILSCQHSVAA
jgi:predicted amino acid racemase